ncbi:MAG: LamG domain-containing protein [Chlorobi bacterium]|nr:LamG domain-containing protein [Chlorobiota bacterium]
MYSKLNDMQNILDTAAVGDEDGTYPYESVIILAKEKENLENAISMANADRFFLQYEIDNYCVMADKAIADFESSLQITLDPGTPAEIKVFGIDQKGRIEFGASPKFGGSDAFTVESWIKYDEGFYESAIGDFLATFNNTADPYEGWMINFMGDNLRATLGMGPQSNRVLEFGSVYPKNYGEWNHIAMVYDASLSEGQLKMYLNGELFFSKTNDIYDESGNLQSYVPNTQNTNMWAFQEPTDLSRCMTGYIKKFRMWDGAKSMEEIKYLMSSDVSGSESDLICAWDFTEMPEDVENIPDKTGQFSAKLVGKYKWYPLN